MRTNDVTKAIEWETGDILPRGHRARRAHSKQARQTARQFINDRTQW